MGPATKIRYRPPTLILILMVGNKNTLPAPYIDQNGAGNKNTLPAPYKTVIHPWVIPIAAYDVIIPNPHFLLMLLCLIQITLLLPFVALHRFDRAH